MKLRNLLKVFAVLVLLPSCNKLNTSNSYNCYECVIDSIHESNIYQHHIGYRTICAPHIDSIKDKHDRECIVKYSCKE